MILKSENVILFLYMINEDSRAIFRDTVNSLEDSSFSCIPYKKVISRNTSFVSQSSRSITGWNTAKLPPTTRISSVTPGTRLTIRISAVVTLQT